MRTANKVLVRLLFSVALIAETTVGSSQGSVTQLGGGVGLQGVTYLYSDTALDRLLLAGAFAYANVVPISPGVAAWSALGIESLGCGVEWNCVTPGSQAGLANASQTVAVWQGDVYLGGDWSFTRNGVLYDHIMRWDGNEWYPVGSGLDGKVKSIKVINGELIVAGWFTHADTMVVNGLARWDGTQWHKIHDIPQLSGVGNPNLIEDVEFFQGQWYIGGNMGSGRDLLRWEGSEWVTVGGGFLGTFSQIHVLQEIDELLYIGGSFSQCPPYGVPSNPGSGIVSWNGVEWDDLGGGTCGSPNNAVTSIIEWNGSVYVTGRFIQIGGVSGGSIARWNGEEWCMLTYPNFWDVGRPYSLALYHDSLYIGGAFLLADGYDVSCFGKWEGGDSVYACGALTTVQEVGANATEFMLFPNPASTTITLQGLPNGSVRFRVYDATGREVLLANASDPQLSIEMLSPGAYTIQPLDVRGAPLGYARFVKY